MISPGIKTTCVQMQNPVNSVVEDQKQVSHSESEGGLLPAQSVQNEVNCVSYAVRKTTRRAGELKDEAACRD